MSGTVDTIKERLSIVDVVGSYIQLQKSGKYFKARSPFTNEKTPSFYVTPDKNLYHCFSTNKGGDIFTFVQEMEGVDFAGALKILAERAGVELVPEDPRKRSERDLLLALMEEATKFFEKNLSKNSEPYNYLIGRGLKDSSISGWRIGFAPNDWHALSDHLKRTLKVTDAEIEACGLSIRGDKGHYDRFRSRIIFPIADASGRVVAFTGRSFGEAEGKGPKYMNSPETQLFDKSSILYGFNKAKQGIHRMGYAVLVEGQMDLIMSHQAGVTNTVASSGTALTIRQLELIHRIAPRIIVAYDADSAGVTATERAWQLALEAQMDVKVVTIPDGKDPADTVAKDPEAWKSALRSSRHLIDFKLDAVMSNAKDGRERAKKVSTEIVPYVARIESSIEQAEYVKRINERLGIPESAVWEEVKRVRQIQKNSTGIVSSASKNQTHENKLNVNNALTRLIVLCRWLSDTKRTGFEAGTIYEQIRAIVGNELEQVEETLGETVDTLVLRINDVYAETADETLKREINELIWHVEIDHLQQKRSKIMSSLTAPPVDDGQDVGRINSEQALKEYQELSKRIHELQELLSR